MEDFRALLNQRTTERGALARLSEISGIPSPVIGRWRDGIGRPSDTNLKKLAPALGVLYEDLLKMCGYLPGEPSGSELHPRLVSLHALLQHASDEDLDVIEDFARWKVQPTQRRAIGRQDAAAKRLKATDRKIGGRRAKEDDEGSSGPLAVGFHAVTSVAAPWRTARATAMGTL